MLIGIGIFLVVYLVLSFVGLRYACRMDRQLQYEIHYMIHGASNGHLAHDPTYQQWVKVRDHMPSLSKARALRDSNGMERA